MITFQKLDMVIFFYHEINYIEINVEQYYRIKVI